MNSTFNDNYGLKTIIIYTHIFMSCDPCVVRLKQVLNYICCLYVVFSFFLLLHLIEIKLPRSFDIRHIVMYKRKNTMIYIWKKKNNAIEIGAQIINLEFFGIHDLYCTKLIIVSFSYKALYYNIVEDGCLSFNCHFWIIYRLCKDNWWLVWPLNRQ